MSFFSILSLVGGLSFFLFGMHAMSSSLEKMAGGRLERSLKKVTDNPFLSLLFGMVITVAMQSSSATTVMLVGLVGSGIMQFSQTIYVILGANVGTTLTAWLLSLSGVEASSVWVQMLKPANFSPIVALVGIALLMFSKSTRKRTVGNTLVGFALLMFGMTMMSTAVSPLAESPAFASMLKGLANPFVGLFLALIFTAVVQSSAAAIGVLQALSFTGSMSVGMMIPMVMGLNIGTCATSMISCIGTNIGAKRVAATHLSIKVLGAVFCLPLFLILKWVGALPFAETAATPWGIALIHTVYNLILTVVFLPLAKPLTGLIARLLKEKQTAEKVDFVLDERLLRVPSIAIAECRNKTAEMCSLARRTILKSFDILFAYDVKKADAILESEDRLDLLEDKLGTYLVPLGVGCQLTEDSRRISQMLHSIGDFERLGDHAVNLLKVSKELHEKKIVFSKDAQTELATVIRATTEILEITEAAYCKEDSATAGRVEPLEQVIDGLIATVKDHHINRLVTGNCTIELGFILSDILTNLERISDHCSNIAVTLIQLGNSSFETHRYLNGIKYGNDEAFERQFAEYAEKYRV